MGRSISLHIREASFMSILSNQFRAAETVSSQIASGPSPSIEELGLMIGQMGTV
jgi:hypothetical protein